MEVDLHFFSFHGRGPLNSNSKPQFDATAASKRLKCVHFQSQNNHQKNKRKTLTSVHSNRLHLCHLLRQCWQLLPQYLHLRPNFTKFQNKITNFLKFFKINYFPRHQNQYTPTEICICPKVYVHVHLYVHNYICI